MGIKTVKDLKEALGDVEESTPVMLWIQPNYPLELSISSVEAYDEGDKHVVYICQGSKEGYAPHLF